MSAAKTRDQAALDACAVAALRAETYAANAFGLSADPDQWEMIKECQAAAHEAVRLAQKAGAASPHNLPPVDRLSLAALATLDSPEARELHRRLAELMPLAEAVDAGRGRTMGEEYEPMPHESRGTDIAETISLLVLRLRNETVGPRGRE